MKLLLHYLFVGMYALSGMWLPIQLWEYLIEPLDPAIHIALYAGWIGVCFSAYKWWPGLVLSDKSLRMIRAEEDEWLHPIRHELNLRTGLEPIPDLFVLEAPDLVSFVEGNKSIILSKGLLVHLSPQEIKAVLAYEYGHLKHMDIVNSTALGITSWLHWQIYFILNTIFTFLKKYCWKRKNTHFKILMGALFLLLCFRNFDVAFLFVILYIFIRIFPFYQEGVRRIWFFLLRNLVLRQYHFVLALGYGDQLESALKKIVALQSGRGSSQYGKLNNVHPVLNGKTDQTGWLDNSTIMS